MDRKLHNRKSIRLQGYDYTHAGLYFVTICTQNREHLFGKINDGQLILNDPGKMIEIEWLKLTDRFKNIRLHEYMVMPNHFHAILEIVGATLVVDPDDKITPTGNGQPQGIAPTGNGQGIAPTGNGQGIAPTGNGQPQGIAPTGNGQPQGIAPTGNGQPQGIAPTGNGQPQGIAPTEMVGATLVVDHDDKIPPTIQNGKTLGEMVGSFKSITTVEYIHGVKTNNWKCFDGKLWQRNYWEHIIRNKMAHQRIAQYIIDNPIKWEKDKLNNRDGNMVMEPSADYGNENWNNIL